MSYGNTSFDNTSYGGPTSAAAGVLIQNPELGESLLSEIAQFAGDQVMSQILQLGRMALENQELFDPFANLVLWLFLLSVAYTASDNLP